MSILKAAFLLMAAVAVVVNAKPSHSFDYHSIPDHFDITPPVLPASHFHTGEPLLTGAHFHTTAGEPVLPAPHFHNAFEPVLHTPITSPALLPPAAQILPALPLASPAVVASFPAPVLPTIPSGPFVHSHVLPYANIVPPVVEAVPFAAPSYRAILGPKTTTHRVSVGYAFPAPAYAKIVRASHAHLHAATPLALPHHHHHHSLHQHSLF